MTEQERIRNGLKFDSLEIRKDIEKVNFSAAVFFISWMITEIVPIPDDITMLITLLVISLVGLFYGIRMFAIMMMKLDFLFAGQFIRDAESVGQWLRKLFKKNNN